MAKRIIARKEVRDIKLPTKPRAAQVGLSNYKWMFHGFPKTGKTTTASFFPNPIFILTEAGTTGINAHTIPEKGAIGNWQEFVAAAKLLQEEDHNFDTVVIDTIDWLYEMLLERIAEQNGVDHVGELGWGAGWQEANKRLWRVLEDIFSGMGLVLISHSKYKDVALGRRQITKVIPDLSDSPRKLLCGWVDISIYFTVEEKEVEPETEEDSNQVVRQHVAYAQPTPYIEAGGRLQYMPERIELGSNPQEGFESLKAAFDAAAKAFVESVK
jgi:hypothetical protein